MAVRKAETFPPVTIGHIRGHGCRDLLIYCGSINCNHSATMNGDWLAEDVHVRSLCQRMVCTKCGMIAAIGFAMVVLAQASIGPGNPQTERASGGIAFRLLPPV